MDKQRISSKLRSCNIQTHLIGFDYLKEAIELAYDNIEFKKNITKNLYPAIAEKFATTPNRVERSIRHAISKGGIEKTNSAFIFDCIEDLKNGEFKS